MGCLAIAANCRQDPESDPACAAATRRAEFEGSAHSEAEGSGRSLRVRKSRELALVADAATGAIPSSIGGGTCGLLSPIIQELRTRGGSFDSRGPGVREVADHAG